MKKTILIGFGLSFLMFTACKKDDEMPKVIYEGQAKKEVAKKIQDSTDIAIADLPILMEGTKYFIHPVGDYRVVAGGSGANYGSSNADKGSFSVSNYNRFELTGYLQNLKFQHIDSTNIKPLTQKPVLIETATYVSTVSEKNKQQLLVYTLVDQDTNKDGVLNSNDIKTLYMSKISGSHFQKLSENLQELIDWKFIESKNRLYYRTIEDTNKNGDFDKDDVVHYNFVDLNTKEWKIANYNPI